MKTKFHHVRRMWGLTFFYVGAPKVQARVGAQALVGPSCQALLHLKRGTKALPLEANARFQIRFTLTYQICKPQLYVVGLHVKKKVCVPYVVIGHLVIWFMSLASFGAFLNFQRTSWLYHMRWGHYRHSYPIVAWPQSRHPRLFMELDVTNWRGNGVTMEAFPNEEEMKAFYFWTFCPNSSILYRKHDILVKFTTCCNGILRMNYLFDNGCRNRPLGLPITWHHFLAKSRWSQSQEINSPTLRDQTSTLGPTLSPKVRSIQECFGPQLCFLYTRP